MMVVYIYVCFRTLTEFQENNPTSTDTYAHMPPKRKTKKPIMEEKRRRLNEIEAERQALLRELGEQPSHSRELELPVTPSTTEPLSSSSGDRSLRTDSSMEDILTKIAKGIDRGPPTLPTFDGDLAEFENFYNEFNRTTQEKDIPAHENMRRLRKALTGNALAHVKDYLDRPTCLQQVMEELRLKYGPSVSLSQNIMARCDKLPRLDRNTKTLQKLTFEVASLQSTIERANNAGLGLLVVEKIQGKLDQPARLDWGKTKRQGEPSFDAFLTWLKGYREAYEAGGGLESPTRDSADRRGRRTSRQDHDYRGYEPKRRRDDESNWRRDSRDIPRYRHESPSHRWSQRPVEQPSKVMTIHPNEVDPCDMGCSETHRLRECPKFAGLNHRDGQAVLRKKKRCFKCYDCHRVNQCQFQQA